MEEYASNSLKSKQKEEAAPEKKLEKAISGSATVKKKSELKKFSEVFISEDAHNVKSYVLEDVLIPAIKKAISDIITNGIDMILYGDSGARSGSRSGGIKPSYRSYYDERDRRDSYRREPRSIYGYDDVLLDTPRKAEELLESMKGVLATYGTVSVHDMYDLAGLTELAQWTDNNYGWTDLRQASVYRIRNGQYTLKLPRALPF